MRVFVAGATGVLGRRAVPALVAAGHEVTALVRSPAKAALARSLGATPVEVSLFDPDALRAAVAGHDAVCNLATHIPPLARAADPRAWQENSRIRSEGSRNLVDAALAAGATCYVQESIAFLYGEHGDEWIDASTAPIVEQPFTDARCAPRRPRRRASRRRAGAASCCGSAASSRPTATRRSRSCGPPAAASRSSPAGPTRGSRRSSADDAATAVVAALDAPSGTYDVVDDEPLRRREQRAGAGRGRGPAAAATWCRARSGSSARSPTRSAYRTSASATRRAGRRASRACGRAGRRRRAPPASSPRSRAGCGCCSGCSRSGNLGVGLQALFTPRSFYDDFPLGRGWVAMDGPYNQHLVRDVGSLNLALGGARVRGAGGRDAHDGPHRDDRVARQRGAALRVPPASLDDEHGGRRQGRDRRDARVRGRRAGRGAGVDPRQPSARRVARRAYR